MNDVEIKFIKYNTREPNLKTARVIAKGLRKMQYEMMNTKDNEFIDEVRKPVDSYKK